MLSLLNLNHQNIEVEAGIFLLLTVNGHFSGHSSRDGVVWLHDLRVHGKNVGRNLELELLFFFLG